MPVASGCDLCSNQCLKYLKSKIVRGRQLEDATPRYPRSSSLGQSHLPRCTVARSSPTFLCFQLVNQSSEAATIAG